MPEKVHHRFDNVPTPFKTSSKGNKRKREHGTINLPNGYSLEPTPSSSAGHQTPLKALESERGNYIRSSNGSSGKNIARRVDFQDSSSHPERSVACSKTQGKHFPAPNPKNPDPDPHPHSNLNKKANALWELRKSLPIWSHADTIRQGLQEKDVMLLVGETGSGKSTQVPQILINEPWCTSKSVTATIDGLAKSFKVGGCIAITEPRRVAAISLARRVAEEMGTPLGSSSPASKVGYSVRFDNSTSPSTRIKFLTEGMLLQEMLRDPWLRQYSAVIVDEVHERGVNVDLVMGFLRNMNAGTKEGRGGVPLKVAVMSATADMEGLMKFFEKGYEGAKTDGVESLHDSPHIVANGENESSEEYSEWSGISESNDESEEMTPVQNTGNKLSRNVKTLAINGEKKRLLTNGILENGLANDIPADERPKNRDSPHVAACYIEGRQYPVEIFYSPAPVLDFLDAALRTIFQIHYKEPTPGDILVFLTGQETVESLEKLVNEYAHGMGPDVPKLLVLPLFAALPQAVQQRVFHPTPLKTRKIVLTTNIAETSVTVSGVRFVIDCGKAKTKQFRTRIGLDSLLVKPISRSAAIQRKGRAGREAPGQCYRMYTEEAYLSLEAAPVPEILRCDLSQALLTMKARGVQSIPSFPFLSPPPREALEKALTMLFTLDALTPRGQISPLGANMAKLPLSVPLARTLLAAADNDCVPEIIDIIACLSVENIFLNLTSISEEKKEEAENARRELYRREGDHLTLLATVQAYAAEQVDRKAWAEKHFVSHRAMQAVMDVRKQLLSLQKLSPSPSPTTPTPKQILTTLLAGFPTNIARLCPDGSYKTLLGNQPVAIHPSSVLFGRKVEAVVYTEFVFTNKSYARGVSGVEMGWVGVGRGEGVNG